MDVTHALKSGKCGTFSVHYQKLKSNRGPESTSLYETQGRIDQPAGQHFTLKNHSTMDMIFLPIERVLPARDAALRKTREKVWITHYGSTTYGKNTHT